MTNGVSAGVYAYEKSLSDAVQAASPLTGAFAGKFVWGPADETRLISGENDLVKYFGKPNTNTYNDWFLAADYASNAIALNLRRIVGANARNATYGGLGTGLTVDITVVNGEVSAVAINAAGSKYVQGDIVTIAGGTTLAKIRVTSVSGTGAVTGISLLTNGVAYQTATGVATAAVTGVSVKNDTDFENQTNLPEVIAKYPGKLGNEVGLGIVRASEFYGWQFQNRFVVAPKSTFKFYDGDKETATFAIPASLQNATDLVVTQGDIEIKAGAGAGTYAISGTNLTITGDTQTFAGDNSTTVFTITNAAGLDLFSSVVKVGTAPALTPRFNGTGHVPKGYFDIDPTTKKLTLGTNLTTLDGNGVSVSFSITTTDTLAYDDIKVKVGGVSFTTVNAAPTTGQARITSITGGYQIDFHASEAPAVGINNVEIEWGFVPTGTNAVITYGLPNGTDDLKMFANQTEVHAVVYDVNDTITGTKNGIIEVYPFLSTVVGAKNHDGSLNYYVDALNRQSSYVLIGNAITHWGDKVLTGGVDDYTLTSGDYQAAYNTFANVEELEVTYVIDPVVDVALTAFIKNMAENRGDCVVFTSPQQSAVVNNAGKEADAVVKYFLDGVASSSYVHVSSGWQYRYDRYNDVYRWVSCNGADAGAYAAAHYNNEPWTVAAGLNRGQYRHAVKLAWSPNEAERDKLYANHINPSVTFAGEGHYLYGSKTYQTARDDAFDRMNVRFLFIYIKKHLAEALRTFLFEINDEVTRARVRNMIAPFMRQIKSRRGTYDHSLVVDGTNNTPTVIDNNELVVSIFIKPSRIVDFITLNLVATSTGLSFQELQGRNF